MPSERRPLTEAELAAVLRRLDDVLAEAVRLRREVSRQLSQQRSDQRQQLSVSTKTKRATSKKR